MTTEEWREGLISRLDLQEASYREIVQRLTALEIKTATEALNSAMIEKRLANIENSLKWITRTFFGVVILYFGQFVLSGSLMIP